MSDSDTIANQIAENLASPKRAKGDSGEVEQFDLKDQIAAARFLASRDATKTTGLGVKMCKLVPPGS